MTAVLGNTCGTENKDDDSILRKYSIELLIVSDLKITHVSTTKRKVINPSANFRGSLLLLMPNNLK
jgi:hypothetical protein